MNQNENIESLITTLFEMSDTILTLALGDLENSETYNRISNIYYKRAAIIRKLTLKNKDDEEKIKIKKYFSENSKVISQITDIEEEIHGILEKRKKYLAGKIKDINKSQKLLIYKDR